MNYISAMPQKLVPVSADIVDFEKRRDAGKYYVYHVEVTLSNGRSYIVFRRYSQFEALHLQLQDNHPVEAGLFEERYKVLPDLPGNMYAGQSAVRDVAMRRVPELNNYLKRLLNLDPRISHDVKVQQFLSLQKGDVDSPVHIYENRLHHLITEAVDARQLLEQTAKEAEEWIESTDSVRDDMSHDGVCCLYDADPVVIATLLPPQSRMPRSVICYFQGLVRKLEIKESPMKFDSLLSMVRKEFRNPYLVINYKDQENDLIRVSNQEDLELMLYCKGKGLLQLYLSNESDLSVYNTQP